MLFGYPIEATTDNWLHDCLVISLHTLHDSAQNGQELPAWPLVIPDQYRESLKGRHGLRDRLLAYHAALVSLSKEELSQVHTALAEQNDIENLLSATCNCQSINDLPESVRQPIKDLFEFSFKLLTELGIRDKQYSVIYESNLYHVCPFCGCEFFDAPGAPREALDHFLAESKYPFAAANLQNLVPMGNKCNSKYKLAQDILYTDDGARRKSFYPYRESSVKVSLDRSDPFEGEKGLFPLPYWRIDFEPDNEEVVTWNTVFHIQERYQRDILDREFMSWLREFSSWCRSANIMPNSETGIVNALTRYCEHMETMRMRDRAFLKAAMFRMLLRHYQEGNQRLITLINGVVVGGMA